MGKRQKRQPGGRRVMSVNPPAEVAGPLGGYRTRPLSQGCRIAAYLVSDAAVEVAAMFTPEEWEALAVALKDKSIEPEVPEPGDFLARVVDRHASHYGLALPDRGGKSAQALVGRLRKLLYTQAWAVLIAVQFRHEHAGPWAEGDHWWELAYRAERLVPGQQATGETEGEGEE